MKSFYCIGIEHGASEYNIHANEHMRAIMILSSRVNRSGLNGIKRSRLRLGVIAKDR
jgi:hypothetical protein